jgi:hypothetical protein
MKRTSAQHAGNLILTAGLFLGMTLARCHSAVAQDTNQPVANDGVPSQDQSQSERTKKPLQPLSAALKTLLDGATALNPEETVFLNARSGRVFLRTEVACPDCVLEMVCVPERRKEHETILRIRAEAFVIHTALLALGLEPGTPVEYSPEFKPPSGTPIQLHVSWIDNDGKTQRAELRSWVRHNIHRYYASPLRMPPPGLEIPYKELRYDKFTGELLWYGPLSESDRDDLLTKWDDADYRKAIHSFYDNSQSRPMTADFIFIGSTFYTDQATGIQHYAAAGGHLICVSNFGDAMIDVREASSPSSGSQVYEGWKEKIPPEGTPVILELTPKRDSTAVRSTD